MDIRVLKLLSEYNKKTNNQMNSLIIKLSDAQWNNEFGGYFKSIRSMCNHIYVCDFNWLKRFSHLREYRFIKNTEIEMGIVYGTMVLNSITDYIEKRNKLDNNIVEFVNEIGLSDIESSLEYADSSGTIYKKNFGNLVLHMFNHQTHHRGMISIYLEEMGIDNDYSNLSEML